MRILRYLWQLPQHIVGLLVKLVTSASLVNEYKTSRVYIAARYHFGVSLGEYIIVSSGYTSKNVIAHEYGHSRQSLMLGPLYLIVIGLPSALGNIWDRVAHKSWTVSNRIRWYYSQPWEAWADKLGGVSINDRIS
jgi:hypothetical protein